MQRLVHMDEKNLIFSILIIKMISILIFEHENILVSEHETLKKWSIIRIAKSHIRNESFFCHLFLRGGQIFVSPIFGIHRGTPMDTWSKWQNKGKIDFWNHWKNSDFQNTAKEKYAKSLILKLDSKSRRKREPKNQSKNTKMRIFTKNEVFLCDAWNCKSQIFSFTNNQFFFNFFKFSTPLEISEEKVVCLKKKTTCLFLSFLV